MPSHPLWWIRTHTDPIYRYILCPECGARFQLPRRGQPGGALATTASLRGMLTEHLAKSHPDAKITEHDS